jgi:hypothetical protein
VKRVFIFAFALIAACVEHPIGDPAGDQNYDDPDDPGTPGENSGGPDASGDAVGRACVAARDCPATMVCAYSIGSGCAADGGVCLPFDGGSDPLNCDASLACGCDGTEVMLCAPNGYSPEKPVKSSNACNAPEDAGTNDATTDAAEVGD